MASFRCDLCTGDLDVLKHPVRRLAWTRHWTQGFKSLFTRPLKVCIACGAIYDWDGDLIAEGAVETSSELQVKALREDMTNMRDAFFTVFLAGQFAAGWMLFGTGNFEAGAPIIASLVGVSALVPGGYFAKKCRGLKKQMKELRKARTSGASLPGS